MPIISAASTTTYITQSSSTSFMITDLRSYTFYQITVAAVTIGPGPNSTIKLIETGEDSKEHVNTVSLLYVNYAYIPKILTSKIV